MKAELETAVAAARAAGELLMREFHGARAVDATEAHDIKLALDRQSQELITGLLLERFPDHAVLGEEGAAGRAGSDWRWVVDPIDGTVNYFYGIPHFCVSIALQRRAETVLGVIFDPARDELWRAARGGPTWLNDRRCAASTRDRAADAVVSVGLAKSAATIDAGLPLLSRILYRVRKCRMMGSAALDLAYVACGRLDVYVESSIAPWDVAAGALLVECAGGRVEFGPAAADGRFPVRAWNGRLDLDRLQGDGGATAGPEAAR